MGDASYALSARIDEHWALVILTAFAYGARLRGVRFGTMGLPMFHALGFFAEVCSPLVLGQPVSVYTPRSPAPPPPPSPQTIYEVAKLTGCTGMYAVPSFVDVRHSSACTRLSRG